MSHEAWCPVAATARLISGKWKAVILLLLKDGPVRFNDIRRSLPEVSQRSLTMQLRALEADGLVVRTDYGEMPPRVDYVLSERARNLGPILDSMERWGRSNLEPARVHAGREGSPAAPQS